MTQATAIIVGASSLLSREIAKQLAEDGVELALLAQDPQSLTEFSQSLPTKAQVFPLQIDDPQAVIASLNAVWQSLGGAHLVLVNTGLTHYDPELPWQPEQDIITVNVQGFSVICNTAFRLFREQGYGQLAAINSIAGLRGGPSVAYHASKAYAQNYLEGLSMHAQRLKLPITITDIQLGMLDKAAMQQNRLWLSPPNVVASQVIKAMKAGKRKAYVTKRWRLVAWLTKGLPEFVYNTRHWKTKEQKKAERAAKKASK
ncbi:SDR family NAD(P)-dependent oxidoreductase [Shewanella fidelis]|uniref:SDR family NAD(P)-dependent oxidoreductase n=1 Tax=Shewanella fidelis TaxID=173509 RepID=A0AAW8NLG9_9GAMM|nr:SDR family NAD(P)-dependent oxidoreductase [Shewanella fidelis]MDR8523155.1 SDR family NAD(P)-dependent oxidoreductase [Shewanella fidelis]MDW4811519.1 SDR family NAD(P)-dependent oxidoreductase [Shewanella fidelis]MDW4815640.1 SDR family NAD(P)-dependent oxidoreductase [Shewanella fidelis]MDW4819730.1 SDR family NAD(P)-dependent oxidoreductase [Shewanella fidelis]MDW4824296.1 SDR family NAD(P)-dependent oxidoreductase [Shewanella fidelis]